MADLEQFSQAVSLIYDAAADPDQWRAALHGIVALFGARGASLMTRNVATMGGSSVTSYGRDLEIEYWTRWRNRNPIAASARAPRPVPIETDRQLLPDNGLSRSDYYQGFLRQALDVHSIMLFWLRREGDVQQYVSIGLHPGAGEFDSRHLKLAQLLSPHLQRAVTLEQRLCHRALPHGGDAFEALPHGIILIDEAGRVLHCNRAALRLLRRREGIFVENGRLHAATPSLSSRLEAVLAQAAGCRAPPVGGGILLPRGRRRPPLSLTAVPLRQPLPWLGPHRPAACVCLADPEAGGEDAGPWLRAAYGLTPAEISVAEALVGGQTLREIGDRLGISYHTAKAHLARIMAKTGTSRQTQLIRLLLTLPALASAISVSEL